MEEQPNPEDKKIDINPIEIERAAERVVELALKVGSVSMALSGVERVPAYRHINGVRQEIKEGTKRENDAEHSFMLIGVALELMQDKELQEYFGDLDKLRVVQESWIHDAPEIFTGDQQTYSVNEFELMRKEENEKRAKKDLDKVLPPIMKDSLDVYEKQKSKESRFVRHLDKLMPLLVDYIGEGSDVIKYDYNINSVAKHKKCEAEHRERIQRMFPDNLASHMVLHYAWEILAKMVTDELEDSFRKDIEDNMDGAA